MRKLSPVVAIPPSRQLLYVGTLSVALNTTADLVVVSLAILIERKLKSSTKLRRPHRMASGLGMISLGACVALADSK